MQHRHQHLPDGRRRRSDPDEERRHGHVSRKGKGRNNYQFFSPEMNVRAVERHNLETALRLAIERQEFVLFFQPQSTSAQAKW
jgi:hypothetical protein